MNMAPQPNVMQSMNSDHQAADLVSQQSQSWMDPSVTDKLSQSIGLFNTVMS